MKLPQSSRQKGFSIVELLIVLTIVLIVAAFAILQIDSSRSSLKMQNVATELKVYLERARFDSLKRSVKSTSEMSRVVINDEKSFTVKTDFNQNGILEGSEVRDIDFSYQDEIKFFGESIAFPVIVAFNHRGQAMAVDGNGNTFNPTFIVCHKSCDEVTEDRSTFQMVAVANSGNVTILNGDQLLDTATPPSGISTDSSSDINPLGSTIRIDGLIIPDILN